MSKIVVLFPGIGYTCDKPLLYYGRDVAVEAGYEECRKVAYSMDAGNIRGNLQKMQEAFETLYAQAQDILADVDWAQYEEVLFLSKSIGTVIAAAYATKHGFGLNQKVLPSGNREFGSKDVRSGDCAEGGPRLRHVLYTPLEHTFLFRLQNAIGFLGTADPWCKPEEVIRLAKEQNVPLHLYEGGNHSLETGDVVKDLDTLRDVMGKTGEFLGVNY